MAETPQYSHHDIARYLQHNMSPQEMHAFEKALMNDPFLADALEGFSASKAELTEAHLNDIERQIAGQREKTKVVPLALKRVSWWKVAAIGLIIVTGGVGSYSLLNNHNNTSIAQQVPAENNKVIARQQSDSISGNESARSEETYEDKGSASQQDSAAAMMPSARAKPAASKPGNREADTLAVALRDRISGVTISDSQTAAPIVMNDAARLDKEAKAPAVEALNEFKGKVTDKSGEPLAFVTITDNRTNAGIVSDADGYFTLRNEDSIVKITLNTAGYSSAVATIRSKEKLNKIVLDETSLALSEVVVTGYGSMKKKGLSNPDSSGAAEPVGGWKNFGQYLNRQIDSLHTTDSKRVYSSGDVVLEFSIDPKGRPSDIQVQEQANQTAANKAVEILENGPRWKKKKNKKVKVVIPFGSNK